MSEEISDRGSENQPSVNNQSDGAASSSADETAEEARLDYELMIIEKVNIAFNSGLKMFETAFSGLDGLGERMDRLTESSRKCREALSQRSSFSE